MLTSQFGIWESDDTKRQYVVVLELNVPPTIKAYAIRRRDLSLKTNPKDRRSPGSNPLERKPRSSKTKYVGHPISSDNGLISQKLILKSEFYYPLYVAMGVAYLCLKYEVLIII